MCCVCLSFLHSIATPVNPSLDSHWTWQQLSYFISKLKREKGNLICLLQKFMWHLPHEKYFPGSKILGQLISLFAHKVSFYSPGFFFSSLFFPFVSFSLLLLNASTLCLEVCTRVPVCISKQLTIIGSLHSTEIIRIELNPPGLKARAFYPLSCLTSLRSLEGSYSLLTWCTIDDVSFYFAVFKMVSFPAVWPWYA